MYSKSEILLLWTRIDDYLRWLISNQSMASLASQNGPTVASKAMSTADKTASMISLGMTWMRGWVYQDRMDDGIWSCPIWVSRLPQKFEGGRGEKKSKKAKKEERNGENRGFNGEQRGGKREEEDILSHFEPSSNHCRLSFVSLNQSESLGRFE